MLPILLLIYLTPLQIELRLMKYFVKSMDRTGKGFFYLKGKFPRVNDIKIKEGILLELIRELINEQNFDKELNKIEKSAKNF